MDLSNVRRTASLRNAGTTLSFPPDLGLTIGPDYNEPCATWLFNRRSEQASGFLEDFRMDV
jgi:hypothetical protein